MLKKIFPLLAVSLLAACAHQGTCTKCVDGTCKCAPSNCQCAEGNCKCAEGKCTEKKPESNCPKCRETERMDEQRRYNQ